MAKKSPINGELILTIRTAKNRQVFFHPTGQTLESEWRASEQLDAPAVIRELGVVPAMQIIVDVRGRRAVIHHRMNDMAPEFDKRVRAAFGSEQGGFNGNFRYPADEDFDLTSRDDMATWMYWLRRYRDEGMLVLESGELPEYDVIRKMGDVRICDSEEGVSHRPGQAPITFLPRVTGDMKELANAF